MGTWTSFLLAYLLGGVTFLPILVILVLLHAHLTFPVLEPEGATPLRKESDIVQPGDDTDALDSYTSQKSPKPTFAAGNDVASGYFAVCRDYTPMGITAKPIERVSPAGSTTVAAPSQSVYQSMYKSIFDRKQGPGPLDDNKALSQRPKRAGNVFFVVLRHGHIMLFDDEEQLEVRHVISLAHHDISIYSGEQATPEGELFIKRNALRLARKTANKILTPDTQVSKPFYLFSENCSAKEDFYFSLLKNQEQTFGGPGSAPKPRTFDVKNIISLVQRLHSNEEQMQTRWLNALIGRIFLGIHGTKDIENSIREKLTKKISRVQRPNFLTRIEIRNIDTGDSAPFITNPRLKDLNVEGEYVMEADIKYTGNFRLEVAAVARIDLGKTLKAREVNLVLAVVLKKLEGHIFFKIKPPPSNRIWFSFQSMPKMEMSIEPIVSSRQITYTVILRQIENRIKEVMAETLVAPFWDDVPFFSTEHKQWRGGIFEGDDAVEHAKDHEQVAAQLGQVDEVARVEDSPNAPSSPELPPAEASHNLPNLDGSHTSGFWNRKLTPRKTHGIAGNHHAASVSATELDTGSTQTQTSAPEPPRVMRTASFSASTPVVGTDPTHADTSKTSFAKDRGTAAISMASISARSQNSTPGHTPVGSPSKGSLMDMAVSHSNSSSEQNLVDPYQDDYTKPGRRGTISSIGSTHSQSSDNGGTTDPSSASTRSVLSGTGSIGKGFFGRRETGLSSHTHEMLSDKRTNTLAAVSSAAASAKRWGWNAIQRQAERSANGRKLSDPPLDLNQPMGRGQPLPPPGTPLPMPGQKIQPITVPRRKPVSANASPRMDSVEEFKGEQLAPPTQPPMTRRRRISEHWGHDMPEENDLVVEAPNESNPTTPLHEVPADYGGHWTDEIAEAPAADTRTTSSDSVTVASSRSSQVEPASQTSMGSTTEVPPSLPARKSLVQDDDEDGFSSWMDNGEEPPSVNPGVVGA
ncbi:uncharacterized protein B0I36DRAFT_428105 [Microdochium trichocladiopsis]|uniref:SMP-LTD domain-containing protein n=1 Tax=Microdochium trichocladiopsis TaxID=1682393 RepID=A0A9P9BUH5_9PEZI|nr:uncharacterized protein B0I36DRAFT_428105 [Microdochium trichocladiopsis]KAH7037484.1 hypothetical protein B0I36DRAFT_428105 [Microdochium trichocladiopsis]